jgi:hypothetical protein
METVGVTGTVGNVITYGAYGSGALPKILGSASANTTGAWTQDFSSSVIFSDGFETGDLSKWVATNNGAPAGWTVSTALTHSGTYSVLEAASNKDSALTKTSIGSLSNATWTLWVANHSTTNPDSQLWLYNAALNTVAQLHFTYASSNLQVTATCYNNSVVGTSTSAYNVAAVLDVWHEVDLVMVTDPAAGGCVLKVDGTTEQTITGLATNSMTVDEIKMDSWAGSYYLDDISLSTVSGTNLWYTSESATPYIGWRDGSRMTVATSKTTLNSDASVTEWWWDSVNSRFYTYAGSSNPTTGSHTFEVAQRNYAITSVDKTNITISGLQCSYTNIALIFPTRSSGTSVNWTITGNTLNGTWHYGIGAIGSAATHFDGFDADSNTISDVGGDTGNDWRGIQVLWGDSVHIFSNTITLSDLASNNYTGGIKFSHASTHANTGSYLRYNTISGTSSVSSGAALMSEDSWYLDIAYNVSTATANKFGVWCDESGNGTNDSCAHDTIRYNKFSTGASATPQYGIIMESASNNVIEYNVVNGRQATSINKVIWIRANVSESSASNVVYGNTLYNPTGGIALQLGWASDGGTTVSTLVKNNIFANVTSSGDLVWADNTAHSDPTSNVFDYNDYFCNGASPCVDWYNSFYGSRVAFHAAVAAQEVHGIDGDPKFTTPASDVLTLQSGSPAINSGVNLGSTYQNALLPVSVWPNRVLTGAQSGKWNIGAYLTPGNNAVWFGLP